MKRKKNSTLTKKVVIAWMFVVFLSNSLIGAISYALYKSTLLTARAEEAGNLAKSAALHIDGDKYSQILDTLEKNDYWYEIDAYADKIAADFDTAYIYFLDSDYGETVTYFTEGMPVHDPEYEKYDLGMPESAEGVFGVEMFETLRTGETTITEPYPSEGYGDMVSGFAAIKNRSGAIVGVVGVDFFYGHVDNLFASFAITIALIIAAFLVVSYFLMTYLGVKLAGKPLADLDKAAQRMATGDMDITLKINSTTEIGRLAESFTRMVEAIREQVSALELLSQGDLTSDIAPRGDRDTMGFAITRIISNLNNMLGEIDQSASQVSSGAREISDSSQTMAQGRSEQISAIDLISSFVTDVTAKAKDNLAIADKANALTNSIKSEAQVGSEHMDKMTLAVKDITDASRSIGKVIKVIDDIAFQTNILALNAAVEAARAGQHGKGFAVVAEEVRNLASKSAEAAKDTEQLISDSISKAQYGAAIAEETGSSLYKIIQGVNECAVMVGDIAGSFGEQLAAMEQIGKGVEQVSGVIQQNSAVAEESAAASEEMSSQAALMEGLVSRFKLKNKALHSAETKALKGRN